MSQVRTAFRQIDVTRALKGVRAAGHEPKAINITPESITVEIGIAGGQQAENLNALDEWRQKNAG